MDNELLELSRAMKALDAFVNRLDKIRFRLGVSAQERAIAYLKSRRHYVFDKFQ